MFNFAPDKYTTYLLVWRCGSSDALAPLFYSKWLRLRTAKNMAVRGSKIGNPVKIGNPLATQSTIKVP